MALVKTDRDVGYFNSYILQRIERNKNFLACVTGQTGSGKSWSALRQAEVLDPEFNADNVAFSPQQFMDLVNCKTKRLKKGSCIVFDELQVSMGHLDYHSIQAKMLNYVLQTFRHRNFILFVTAPHFSFINLSARKLFHCRQETISIDKNKKQVTLKPLLLQTNQDTGNVYRKYLRVYLKDKGLVPLKRIKVGMPSPELIKAYEEKKTAFTKELNEGISRDLEQIENKKTNTKPLTQKQEEIIMDMMEGLSIEDISKKRNLAERVVYFHISQAKKKGIKINPVKEKGSKVVRYDIGGYNATL